MNYCADCAYMKTDMKSNHKYECDNKRSGYDEVSCCKEACSNFCPSSRDAGYNQKIFSYSYRNGYYLASLICETLCFEDKVKDRYLNNMAYMKEIMLPLVVGGINWIKEYDEYGPKIVDAIKATGNTHEICMDLHERYFKKFNELFEQNEIDEAFTEYNNMFQETKNKYCALGQRMN